MLNVATRISLSKFSKRKLKELVNKYPSGFDVSAWDKVNVKVKNELSKKLFFNQNGKCVYCERDVVDIGPEIDHFAHKALYPQFSFTATNLFYSCHFCNSGERKGQKPTIENLEDQYQNCLFSIVHPYYGNPEIEIRFKDTDRIDFDWGNCTDLGKDTIKFFGFDDAVYTLIRSKNYILGAFATSINRNEAELINKSITYKSRRRKP